MNDPVTLCSFNRLGLAVQFDYANGRHLTLLPVLDALQIAYDSGLLGIQQGHVGDSLDDARRFLLQTRQSIPASWSDFKDKLVDPTRR